MSKQKVIAIFDIGKTNKKFLLFDESFNVLLEESMSFEETQDDDGFPCDDLQAITKWIDNCLESQMRNFDIQQLNFATYGATLVHIDVNGEVLTPLYNYLKPLPDKVHDEFYSNYGPKANLSKTTASPALEMLNSGLQLYWLKHTKTDIFSRLYKSLHFPNYLSYRYSKKLFAEKTSIGCHTALWDFEKNQYHSWLKKEDLLNILPYETTAEVTYEGKWHDKTIACGTGLHDSSAALIPYIECLKKPFILLSTGTWNIALNPFAESTPLTSDELENDVLYFFNHRGKPVKASRLFLGNEHNKQDQLLASYFHKSPEYHRNLKYDHAYLRNIGWNDGDNLLKHAPSGNSLEPLGGPIEPSRFTSYEDAYHYLNLKLAASQARAIDHIYNGSGLKHLYVTGGFIQNEIFLELLASQYKHLKVRIANLKRASALGAAMVMNPQRTEQFSKKHFYFKRVAPLIA